MGHWQGGSTRAWRTTRDHVFAEKGRTCQLRLPGCTTEATHIHHTQDRNIVGDDPRFLIPACPGCNIRAGDPTQHLTDPEPLHTW